MFIHLKKLPLRREKLVLLKRLVIKYQQLNTFIHFIKRRLNMKKVLLVTVLFLAIGLQAQESQPVKTGYWSFASEMIFSFAQIDNAGNEEGNVMRWSPVINLQSMYNYDMSKSFGLFSGVALRNVGFIYEDPYDPNNTKFKYRTYNLGVPVGFKIGKMGDVLFFGGYEIELPITYKEKRFVNEDKVDKDLIWFSDKVEPFQQSVLAGVQLPYGATIKFKYYFTNFHNRDYVAMVDGNPTKPYDFKSNVFYFSICYDLFKNWEDTYDF